MPSDPLSKHLNELKMNGNHFFEIAQNAFTNPNSKEEALATYNALMASLDEFEQELEKRDIINLSMHDNQLNLDTESTQIRTAVNKTLIQKQELQASAIQAVNQITQ